jgi:ADP-ribosylglycohydrolase
MQEITWSRFRGCLLGSAVGDALGMPVEGARASSIRQRLGEVRDFLPAPWRNLRAGQWTDDTKMMLCHARSIARKEAVDPEDIAGELLGWMDSGDWRGMGNATYSSLKRLRQGASPLESGEVGETAAGGGGAMRIAPVALFRCRDLEALRRDVETSCRITHRDPEAVAGSLAVAYVVARAAVGELDPSRLLQEAASFIGPCAVGEKLALAGRLLEKGTDDTEALLRLGTGGHVAETVASAFFCFLRHLDDLEGSLVAAVSGGQDAGTTAAVTGAMSGAWLGEEAIPARWLEGLEGAGEIRALADVIHDLVFPPR